VLKTYVAAKMQIEKMKDRFTRDEDGAALIEYSILIGLISALAVAGVTAVGGWVQGQWGALQGALGIGG
jgi:pilus assembly protein Flp/PilA